MSIESKTVNAKITSDLSQRFEKTREAVKLLSNVTDIDQLEMKEVREALDVINKHNLMIDESIRYLSKLQKDLDDEFVLPKSSQFVKDFLLSFKDGDKFQKRRVLREEPDVLCCPECNEEYEAESTSTGKDASFFICPKEHEFHTFEQLEEWIKEIDENNLMIDESIKYLSKLQKD